ncbi:MAG: polysaccharide deacetylase family protein [Ruthenibacterium sp.]
METSLKKIILRTALGALGITAFCACVYLTQPAMVGCRNEDLLLHTLLPAEVSADSAVSTEKVVYLTFDDGPSKTTALVLDALAKAGVPATFFVIGGEQLERNSAELVRAVNEGHLIALHSDSHEYKNIYKSSAAYWADIEALKEHLLPFGYVDKKILRFPGGSTNTVSHKYGGADIMDVLKAQAVERGYTYVDWNVCADDALGGHPSADKIYNNVIHDVGEQRTVVVLMHDAAYTKNTAAALPDIILWFKNAGFRFDTVDHLTKQI